MSESVLDKLGLKDKLPPEDEGREEDETQGRPPEPPKAEKEESVPPAITDKPPEDKAEEVPKATKKKAKKKRAKKKASVKSASDPLSLLNQELSEIANEARSTSEENRLRAELRSEKALRTQLAKFAKRVEDALAAAEGRIAKLEGKLKQDGGGDDG